MSRTLDVYMHDQFVGKLVQGDSGNLSFTYDKAYVEKRGLALSFSLPLREAPYDEDRLVRAFFSGLLPDESLRERLAKYLGVSERNPFSLLVEVGGDCAGSISLYPEGSQLLIEEAEPVKPLTEDELADVIDILKRRPMLVGGEARLSLAGAQNKLPILYLDGQLALARGTTPTTHILKPPIKDREDSAFNELFCMRLGAAVGLDVPATDIVYIKDLPCFVIERYDRIRNKKGQVERIHQEDFCQALGIFPDAKYEKESGLSFHACQQLIKEQSAKPALDQTKMLRRFIFNYLIGNADAHGKNFSFLYVGAKPILSPAYDLLCTAVYSDLSTDMAMKIGSKYKVDDVFLRHWHSLVPETKIAHKILEKELLDMSVNVLGKANQVKKNLKEQGLNDAVFDRVIEVIQKRSSLVQKRLAIKL